MGFRFCSSIFETSLFGLCTFDCQKSQHHFAAHFRAYLTCRYVRWCPRTNWKEELEPMVQETWFRSREPAFMVRIRTDIYRAMNMDATQNPKLDQQDTRARPKIQAGTDQDRIQLNRFFAIKEDLWSNQLKASETRPFASNLLPTTKPFHTDLSVSGIHFSNLRQRYQIRWVRLALWHNTREE